MDYDNHLAASQQIKHWPTVVPLEKAQRWYNGHEDIIEYKAKTWAEIDNNTERSKPAQGIRLVKSRAMRP